MRRIVVFTLLILGTAFTAQAFQLGPATPAAGHGQVSVGAGYFFHQAEWDSIDVEQNRGYLHLGYGMGIEDEPRWEVYIRGGAADLEDESGGFDADYEPFGALGLKGAFHDGRRFGWGMVLQGAYFAGFRSGDIDIEDVWEIEAGFPFQVRLWRAIFYAGPVFYHAEADAENGFGPEMELDEDNNFGGFGGIAFDFGRFRLEAEAQIKSEVSAGGFLSVQF